MLRKVSICYIIIVALLLCSSTLIVFAAPGEEGIDSPKTTAVPDKTSALQLKAKSFALMDGITGSILLENNSHERLPIASVTKIMSIILFMEAISNGKLTFEDMVPVTENSYRMGGTQVWLEPGEEFTVNEMMKAVVIRSANDATVAMAEKIAGSEDAFVAMMNEKAKALGMNDTYFLDSTGLTDEGHYSSAYDIAVMSKELITKHLKIIEYTMIWHDTFRDGVKGKNPVSLDNTNSLVKTYEGINGLKTGFTIKAGYCLSATAKRKNLQLVSVVLGETNSNTRFAEAKKLLDYGFANYETSQVNVKDDQVQEVEVRKGIKSKVNAIYADNVQLLLKKGETGKIERQVKLEESITAPVKIGQKLGEIVYKVNGNEVGKTEIVAGSEVQKASFLRLVLILFLQWFSIGRM